MEDLILPEDTQEMDILYEIDSEENDISDYLLEDLK